jgi:primosomal replication protein N
MQHRALGAFFVVENELNRDARLAGPIGLGRRASVPDQIAGVGLSVVGFFHSASARRVIAEWRYFPIHMHRVGANNSIRNASR